MLDIKQIALEVARMDELMGPKDTFAFTKDRLVDFATRFLAAITEKAEPFCYHYITNGTWDFFTKELPPDDAYDEGTLTKLFTHLAIEPAGEVVVTTTEEGSCVCVTRQDEEGRILKVLWEAPAIEPAQDEKLRFALENCRLLAARHRKEDWALLILGFCAEGGVAGSPLRDGGSK